MIKKIKRYFKDPFSDRWEKTKKYYVDIPSSYYMLGRIDSALASTSKFQAYNFWARFVPEIIIFKYFKWYSCSKIGRIIENFFHK